VHHRPEMVRIGVRKANGGDIAILYKTPASQFTGGSRGPTADVSLHIPLHSTAYNDLVGTHGPQLLTHIPSALGKMAPPSATYSSWQSEFSFRTMQADLTLLDNTNPQWWKDPGLRRMSFHIMALYLCVFTFGVSSARQGQKCPDKTSMMAPYSMGFKLYRDGSKISIVPWAIPWDSSVLRSIFVRLQSMNEQ
jgi:hypothetical protein